MEEKLIIISIEDIILDSFIGTVGFVNSSEYYLNNHLECLNIMEFEAFVFVNVEFK